MAFWGVEIKAGKPFYLSPDKSHGRLRISQATLGIGSSNNKSLVQCNVGKNSPVLLCCLLPDKAESCPLDLEFDEAEGVTFSVIGPRSVFLTGYFLYNARRMLAGDDESESYGEDIGETDVEKSDDFSDKDEYEEDSFIDDSDPVVFAPSPSPSDETNKKKFGNKFGTRKSSRKRLKKKYEISESEDGDVISQQNANNDNICEKIAESEQEDEMLISSLRGSAKTGDKNSRKRHEISVKTTDDLQSEDIKVKTKKKKNNIESKAPVETVNLSSMEKNATDSLMETGGNINCSTRTISGGLIVEELESGEEYGELASSGKKVTIHYTGKLKEGGKIFDSSAGKKPLKFRLGKGRVMDGLDLGTEGMRVGGKRRLHIPPALGFGTEGSSRVPPDSWLIMDVELLQVQ